MLINVKYLLLQDVTAIIPILKRVFIYRLIQKFEGTKLRFFKELKSLKTAGESS